MKTKTTKEAAMGEMALIGSLGGQLIAYSDLEAMYNVVVHHRRWWRRVLRAIGYTA